MAVRSFLLRYVQSDLSELEAVVFEAHLLGCDVCYLDLQTLDRASRLVKSMRELPPSQKDDIQVSPSQRTVALHGRSAPAAYLDAARRPTRAP